MADLVDVEDLLAGEDDDMNDPEAFNPKSKTTNMSSLLKQINKSIKKTGGNSGKPNSKHYKCKYLS